MENVVEIERIVKNGLILEVNGQKYSSNELHQISDNRKVCSLRLNTLTGFVDFINSKDIDISKCIIFIVDFNKVDLISPINSETKHRDCYVQTYLKDENKFPFGSFMESEDFIIKLNSLFVNNSDRAKLIAFVSSLSINNSIDSEDDGITQNVVVKKGISGALKDRAQSPSVVNLIPYRTFREINQPESSFLFRMKAYDQKIPTCALFEADGGEWKNEAIDGIKIYLESEGLGLTIIA